MKSIYTLIPLFGAVGAKSLNYCPLLGAVYSTPKTLCKDAAFQEAKHNISLSLDAIVAGKSSLLGSTYVSDTTSLSVQIWSTSDSKPEFEYYYTSPLTKNARVGVTEVNEDTVFRIGSASKLWTVLLLLIENGDAVLSDRVVKWVPELAAAAKEIGRDFDRINHVDWNEVTLFELASQLSGVARDYAFGDLATLGLDLTQDGFPQLSKVPPCGNLQVGACNRTQYLQGILQAHPTFPTAHTPSYSNANFQILAYALEAMTNETYDTLLSRDLIKPLGLEHLTSTAPADKYGIIPWDAATSYWALNSGDEAPAGGLYASTKDMVTLGRAVLNNTLLSPALTRRWMKPAAHMGSLTASVGAPWEIFTIPTSRAVDVYTKSGDLCSYSSMTALSPDHGVGFTILAAGNHTTAVVQTLTQAMMEILVPALDAAAKEEAVLRFTGTYAHNNNNRSNYSITITTDGGPGLKVEEWINDSVDVIDTIQALEGYSSEPSVRMYPTGLESSGQVSFVAIIQQLESASRQVPCTTWYMVDSQVYGNVGVDEFLFQVDGQGDVVALSPRTLRTVLPKVSSKM
ncbi:hypothetical protein PISL3812_06387 [Talaromyces islandicus]|uniref:Uncharacterized protein n=1 Tax=Talaromyces islandicus TaxID=28573 RepID=A0A0U1M2Z1_TALIS|nr:hypothetical protein PISL3812_06387 [Talaromyces islandicus]